MVGNCEKPMVIKDEDIDRVMTKFGESMLLHVPSMMANVAYALHGSKEQISDVVKPESRMAYAMGTITGMIGGMVASAVKYEPNLPLGDDPAEFVVMMSMWMYKHTKEIKEKMEEAAVKQGTYDFMQGAQLKLDDGTFLKVTDYVRGSVKLMADSSKAMRRETQDRLKDEEERNVQYPTAIEVTKLYPIKNQFIPHATNCPACTNDGKDLDRIRSIEEHNTHKIQGFIFPDCEWCQNEQRHFDERF